MSMTFVASTLESTPDGPTFVEHPNSRSTNFANLNALRILGLMGADADYCGAMTLDEATKGIVTARLSSSLGDTDRLRLVILERIVDEGRRIGATHLSWA